jgi:hypothetical protein
MCQWQRCPLYRLSILQSWSPKAPEKYVELATLRDASGLKADRSLQADVWPPAQKSLGEANDEVENVKRQVVCQKLQTEKKRLIR